jgi:hypothetical protein
MKRQFWSSPEVQNVTSTEPNPSQGRNKTTFEGGQETERNRENDWRMIEEIVRNGTEMKTRTKDDRRLTIFTASGSESKTRW